MLGSFVGDFVGSAYEHADIKGFNLPLVTNLSNFTDDSIMTAATIDSIMNKIPFDESLMSWCSKRRDAGFSETMKAWMDGEDVTYLSSTGNGAAIRVAPLAYVAESVEHLFEMVEKNAMVTHPSNESIVGAQAIALAVYCVRQGFGKEKILNLLKLHTSYSYDFDLDQLHEDFQFTTEAKKTVPVAIFLALTSDSLEQCLRKGLHVGGDVDSILSMACAIMMAKKDVSCPLEVLEKMKSKAQINDPELLIMLKQADELRR